MTSLNNIKVLILEDEPIIAQDISEIAQSLNLKTSIVHSYNDGIEIFKDFSPDLLLCDVNLNDKSYTGLDFATKIRETSSIDIIFITAYRDNETIEKAKALNPINFLLKPFNENQIRIALTFAIDLIQQKTEANPNLLATLSEKEVFILKLIAQQKTSKEISEELFVSEKTIRNHRYNISKKLALSGENNSLLNWAMKNIGHK